MDAATRTITLPADTREQIVEAHIFGLRRCFAFPHVFENAPQRRPDAVAIKIDDELGVATITAEWE